MSNVPLGFYGLLSYIIDPLPWALAGVFVFHAFGLPKRLGFIGAFITFGIYFVWEEFIFQLFAGAISDFVGGGSWVDDVASLDAFDISVAFFAIFFYYFLGLLLWKFAESRIRKKAVKFNS